MDKVKIISSENQISPYLRRPLRSFSEALAERQTGATLMAEAEKARMLVSQGRGRNAPERLSA